MRMGACVTVSWVTGPFGLMMDRVVARYRFNHLRAAGTCLFSAVPKNLGLRANAPQTFPLSLPFVFVLFHGLVPSFALPFAVSISTVCAW